MGITFPTRPLALCAALGAASSLFGCDFAPSTAGRFDLCASPPDRQLSEWIFVVGRLGVSPGENGETFISPMPDGRVFVSTAGNQWLVDIDQGDFESWGPAPEGTTHWWIPLHDGSVLAGGEELLRFDPSKSPGSYETLEILGEDYRAEQAVQVSANEVYVFGNRRHGISATGVVWRLELSSGQLQLMDAELEDRTFSKAPLALCDGRVYINSVSVAYEDGPSDDRRRVYDPSTDAFEELPNHIWAHNSVRLDDTRVLLVDSVNLTSVVFEFQGGAPSTVDSGGPYADRWLVSDVTAAGPGSALITLEDGHILRLDPGSNEYRTLAARFAEPVTGATQLPDGRIAAVGRETGTLYLVE